LDGVEELDALGHRPLEGFSSDDEAGAAGPLVDDGRADGLTMSSAPLDAPPELMRPMRPA